MSAAASSSPSSRASRPPREPGANGDLTVGIDEAGRGAVLGPLVLAACALDPAAEQTLGSLGVTDSKAFGSSRRARARRAALGQAIREHAAWVQVRPISPKAVDRAVARQGLNRLEQQVAAELARAAPRYGRLVLDGARLFAPLAHRLPRAEAHNRADQDVPAVAAASILAKVARDEAFATIAERYAEAFGPLSGGGYPNRATAAFLDRYWAATHQLPPETRLTWRWGPVSNRAPGTATGPGTIPLPFDQ